MSNDRARLFVALELPRNVREALVRWRERLGSDAVKRLRPIASEALHVTLCFLGWRAEDEVSAIAAACTVVAAEAAPALSLGASLWLPRRRPRVLAVELEDAHAGLARVQAALSGALSAGGWYEPENRPYLAHVTVARVKGDGRDARLPEPPAPPRLNFQASRVVLYRSRLSRAGAHYEPLGIVELAGGIGGG
ncbi:MAG TPA: RNA 2',3'-cyclic phosphodiesterase [Solirubrobacteraceae bacterium]|nr:RNA 2',3'-cyclic phosphodiesterase [Solirubrobacteraceae bacterium]